MAGLLTTEEYKAIATSLSLPTQSFIDGAFRPAQSGATFDTHNPATGKVLAKVAACDARDVDLAVSRARAAFAERLTGPEEIDHPAPVEGGDGGVDELAAKELGPVRIEKHDGDIVVDRQAVAFERRELVRVVRDDIGQTSGVGSRFFRVQN